MPLLIVNLRNYYIGFAFCKQDKYGYLLGCGLRPTGKTRSSVSTLPVYLIYSVTSIEPKSKKDSKTTMVKTRTKIHFR